MGRHNAALAAGVSAALLLGLSACGGTGTAAAPKAQDAKLLGEQVASLVTQVDKMAVVEWHGQLLTKNPDDGGQRMLGIDGRFSPATGHSELSVDSTMEGDAQQVDYLLVDGRSYFNSEAWGPGAASCWADITGDAARTWSLPTELDPSWPLKVARATRLDGEDVAVMLPFKQVIAGMPRGLFAAVPTVPYDTEAIGFIAPHGELIEVGVDVVSMWKKVPKDQRAELDTSRVGWWAMTMKESQDGSPVQPPKHVFDPAVTPPSQCMKA